MKQTYQIGGNRVVAVIEKAEGNESIGSMWLETRSFDKTASLEEVLNWARENHCAGRLVLTVDKQPETGDEPF